MSELYLGFLVIGAIKHSFEMINSKQHLIIFCCAICYSNGFTLNNHYENVN